MTMLLLALALSLFAQSTKSDVRVVENSPVPIEDSPGSIEEALLGHEHKFWDAWKRKDITVINELVAENARFVDENSVISKEEFTRQVRNYTPNDYSLTRFEVITITDKVGVVTYKVRATYTANSIELPLISALVTSVWFNQQGKWQLKHHHFGLMPVTKADP
jgi:hypothetical protein